MEKSGISEHIEGSVEIVTFHSEDSGFAVLKINAKGHRERVTLIGKVPQIVPGEWVVAEGEWILDKKHGKQFKARELKSNPPDSPTGMKKFLGSGLIKGVGPVYASKIVDHFGKDTYDIIDKESARLEQVDGIGRKRRLLIKESWNETQSIRSIMAFLLVHNVSTTRAFRIYKTYGEQAIRKVEEDPYRLARDIKGIGFKMADQVAASLGIARNSELRARAGIEHVLFELTQDGHCAYPRDDLIELAREILEIEGGIIEKALQHGLEQGRLIERKPLIYLSSLFRAEERVAYDLIRLTEAPHPCPAIHFDKAIEWVQKQTGLQLASAQVEAIRHAVTEKFLIITGGPGVGKTTVINAIIKILEAKKLKVVLCAPTGRAAKRMTETSGKEAKTIHRTLAFDPGKGAFRFNAETPLSGDIFIVDECSMIDLPLAAHLISAIPRHAALIMVGDADQLPSVGPGTVLKDLIASGRFSVSILSHIFRQAAESHIIINAHRIHEGSMPITPEKEDRSDFYFAQIEDPEAAAQRIVEMASRTIPKKYHLNPMRDIQILSPMRKGQLGSMNLNLMLQDRINPSGEEVQRFGITYRMGDKVMQLENDYDKDVFNGDMGVIDHIDFSEQDIVVNFDGRRVYYSFQELDELTPCYAITIHKSQGSEFPCVIIPVHTQHFIMLQRNLIYTALTRGKKLVVLVGTRKALAMAVKREDAKQRITTLSEKLAL